MRTEEANASQTVHMHSNLLENEEKLRVLMSVLVVTRLATTSNLVCIHWCVYTCYNHQTKEHNMQAVYGVGKKNDKATLLASYLL